MRGYRSNYKPWWVADRAAMVTVVPPRQANAWPRHGYGVADVARAIDRARALALPGREQATVNEVLRSVRSER